VVVDLELLVVFAAEHPQLEVLSSVLHTQVVPARIFPSLYPPMFLGCIPRSFAPSLVGTR
jgi:hypothetical protein